MAKSSKCSTHQFLLYISHTRTHTHMYTHACANIKNGASQLKCFECFAHSPNCCTASSNCLPMYSARTHKYISTHTYIHIYTSACVCVRLVLYLFLSFCRRDMRSSRSAGRRAQLSTIEQPPSASLRRHIELRHYIVKSPRSGTARAGAPSPGAQRVAAVAQPAGSSRKLFCKRSKSKHIS